MNSGQRPPLNFYTPVYFITENFDLWPWLWTWPR